MVGNDSYVMGVYLWVDDKIFFGYFCDLVDECLNVCVVDIYCLVFVIVGLFYLSLLLGMGVES